MQLESEARYEGTPPASEGIYVERHRPGTQQRMSLKHTDQRLEANFTKASLIVPESRIVAGLLLEGADASTWHQRIVVDNVLQKRTTNTAKSYATIARHRLQTMGETLWEMVRNGGNQTATQAVLAATLKFSPLLALFLNTALADEYRRMSSGLREGVWNSFFEDCAARHENLAQTTEATRSKLRQNAFRILQESGYIGPRPHRALLHVRLEPPVRDHLEAKGEVELLKTMDVAR